MPLNQPPELADSAEGRGWKEEHKSPRIRLLFAKNIKRVPALVVITVCGFRFAQQSGKGLNLKEISGVSIP
jgi:hypothetical protein